MGAESTENSVLSNVLPILFLAVAAVLVVYYFFILPRQRQKKDDGFFNSLKPGDSVVTLGGIHGVIVDMVDNQALLQMVGGNAKLLVERHSISPEGTEAIYRKKTPKPAKRTKGVKKVATKTKVRKT